ncbi:Protein slit [Camponotus floridanus]|uniref:Protein slit n=1 Tax=Camponotus floridanus TaxID=104421 RepID=E2B243_CAMFO|nr:Protein slit [Camponotus floridanus]
MERVVTTLTGKVTSFVRDLQGNNISVIFKTDFEDMATLHVLLLSSNQIHTIERGAFQDLVAVEKLRLNNNQIRHLPDLLFSNMMNLKRLEKQNRDRPGRRATISRLYRDGARGTNRFRSEIPGVPGSCQPRSRKVHESSPLVVDDRTTGSGKRAEAQKKERQEERQQKAKKEKNMRKKERRRSFIYHPAKWARWTGLETSRLPLGGCASLGHNLQFLTIRLDQPPYKRTYYVTTLRQDSHERLDAR